MSRYAASLIILLSAGSFTATDEENDADTSSRPVFPSILPFLAKDCLDRLASSGASERVIEFEKAAALLKHLRRSVRHAHDHLFDAVIEGLEQAWEAPEAALTIDQLQAFEPWRKLTNAIAESAQNAYPNGAESWVEEKDVGLLPHNDDLDALSVMEKTLDAARNKLGWDKQSDKTEPQHTDSEGRWIGYTKIGLPQDLLEYTNAIGPTKIVRSVCTRSARSIDSNAACRDCQVTRLHPPPPAQSGRSSFVLGAIPDIVEQSLLRRSQF